MRPQTILSFSLLAAFALTAGAAGQIGPRGGGGGRPAPPPPPPADVAPPADPAAGTRIVTSRIVIGTRKGQFVITREGDDVNVRPEGRVGQVDVQQDREKVVIRDENGVLAEVRIAPDGGLRLAMLGEWALEARELAMMRAMERGGFGAGGAGGGGGFGSVFTAPRAQLGITLGRVDDALAAQLGIDPNEVILITNAADGTAAEKAGLQRHDIIIALDGQKPVTQDRLRELMRSKEPGDVLRLDILREGKPLEVEVKLEPFALDRWQERLAETREITEAMRALNPEDLRRWVAPQASRDVYRELIRSRPELERAAVQLKREAEVLREAMRHEWQSWRETAMDEELHARLRESLSRGADTAASALERAAEALSSIEIEIDGRAPRVEILREGGDRRGMIVSPPSAPRGASPPSPPRGPGGGGGMAAPAVPAERFERMEERLERLERMLQRLLEREEG